MVAEKHVHSVSVRPSIGTIALICLGLSLVLFAIDGLGRVSEFKGTPSGHLQNPVSPTARCSQCQPLRPSFNESLSLTRLSTPKFIEEAALKLSHAVSIRTESYDDGSVNVTAFLEFHEYLEAAFPLVHSSLKKRVIANYSLLYEWKGSREDKDPLILMAHIDVVPVLPETANQWKYDPYSGYVDFENDRVWGRGSADTKQTLISILAAVEALLEAGWKSPPDGSTIYLAFGNDEESSGDGALAIAEYLEYELGLAGKVGLIVDEGGGLFNVEGVTGVAAGVSEKGYVDVDIIVEAAGGHSSVPPKHTAIGYSAMLIAAIEENPFPLLLSNSSVFLSSLQCLITYSPNPNPFLKWAVENLPSSLPELTKQLAKQSEYRSLLATTQAVDVIRGGLKVNALPEKVVTTVNHRISADSSLKDVEAHYFDTVFTVALVNGLSLTVHDFKNTSNAKHYIDYGPDERGRVTIMPKQMLEPSPVSPYLTSSDRGWMVLEGTIHHVLDESERFKKDVEKPVVIPIMMGGNTDTKSFWRLAKSIYRIGLGAGENIHTVDEYATISGYIDNIKFFHELIRNWSEGR